MSSLSFPSELFELADTAELQYRVYQLKRGRKRRQIEAPNPELKEAQRWLLETWLYQLSPTDMAHGFVTGRSIVTNARCHVGKELVVTADIRNFFPSITASQVFKVLTPLNLSLLERCAVVKLVTRGGRLPQGAPTSPHLANLVAREIDLRLQAVAIWDDWAYTRYADDLAFSGNGDAQRLLRFVEEIVIAGGFHLADNKTRIMPKSRRQLVTGLVVNQRVALPKPKRRILRAMQHRIDTGTADPQELQSMYGQLALAKLIAD
jgi:retron-type reverse transcriptase